MSGKGQEQEEPGPPEDTWTRLRGSQLHMQKPEEEEEECHQTSSGVGCQGCVMLPGRDL